MRADEHAGQDRFSPSVRNTSFTISALPGACHQEHGFACTIDERKSKRDPISIQLLDPIRNHQTRRLRHCGRSRKQGSRMTFIAHPEQDQIKARKLSWLQFAGLKNSRLQFKELPDHSFVLFGCFCRAQFGRHTEDVLLPAQELWRTELRLPCDSCCQDGPEELSVRRRRRKMF